ncbi:putative beta-defensin 109B [Panthera leo]|uniref:putative beta-defensin 109B n=1 Tax=Panthera leo TaxID=9689 RepID=UPI001C6A540C|nr:putative beta-defensin 109B [Panthera leo]XP_042790139.1 putative beta-defensin 109B [Panthera leo]
MSMPLFFTGRSAMGLHVFLFALLFLTLLSPVRSGMASAENHCLNLSGICRRDICKITEDQIGACKRRWKCCRSWWILVPIPTPLIYSDYQAPLKHKLK